MNERKPWLKKDVDRIRAMWLDGMTDADIAREMGRTERSVAIKRHRMGICARRPESDRPSTLAQYNEHSLINEVQRRGWHCMREIRTPRDYSDETLVRELRRRGYAIYRRGE